MQRIFVYEFMTGGGLLAGEERLEASLVREGQAMVSALIADFARLDGIEVVRMLDDRLLGRAFDPADVAVVSSVEQEQEAFVRNAASADFTVLIAPELDGRLLRRAETVIAAGGRLLGPSTAVIALASDKHATAEHLRARGVPAPRGVVFKPGQPFPADVAFPAVAKPLDGAGSHDLRQIDAPLERVARPTRIETYHPGLAASVAVLCSPTQRLGLPPCRQRLSDDGRFRYLGGSSPLPAPLAARATALAESAIAALAGDATGYLGVDLVLGDDPAGRDDVVIEINPRLTTSYVGLQALTRDNLAAAMLAMAAGRHAALHFADTPVEFDSDGTVRVAMVPATVGATT